MGDEAYRHTTPLNIVVFHENIMPQTEVEVNIVEFHEIKNLRITILFVEYL